MRPALRKAHSHGLGSVLRFQRWVECLSPPLKQNTFARFIRNDMPPIDVWMVLHAYLLNPQSAFSLSSRILSLILSTRSRSFAEDCIRLRLLRPLAILMASIPDFFFDVLVSGCMTSTFHLYVYELIPFAYKDTINDMILWKPRSASRSSWVTKTGLPFDPFESAAVLLHQDLLCPKCKTAVSVRECTNFCENSRVLRMPSIHNRYRDGLCPTKLFVYVLILHIRNNEGETRRRQADYRPNYAPVA